MIFPSIEIQGSILSTDILSKIRSEQASFQFGKDFNADFTNAKLKDEISLAWQEAKGQWTIFKSKLNRVKEGESGTTETRYFWISPLLTNLGYNLIYTRQSEELNGKSFPVGYRDNTLDNFPIYIGGYFESLDRRPESKHLRVSPHALLQEYLNYSEHLYGIVTNGRQLRLLRDASRITRPSYVEFDLEKMLEEDLYSDFVILYRLLHASRMPKKIDRGPESIIEFYHQEGLAAGSAIRNKLGEAVKGAIKTLANGFINHPGNFMLREVIAKGHFDESEYYRYQLRIIYRLLFLFVIEERNLVYTDSKTHETKRFNQIYFSYYSLQRLRKMAKKLPPPDANRHFDLWQGLISTFSLFEKKEIGEKLGIMSLQGDLFGYESISNSSYDLHQCFLSNAVLLNIIGALTYFENEDKILIAVNYGGLDVEEFGSVYEGLLELKLIVRKVEGSELYSCSFSSSNERGKSGSHYTPEELVQPLIKHSLEYLIEDRTKAYYQKKATKESTIGLLFSLRICDVACGSGHILLSAARRLALEIAKIGTEEEQPNPLSIRQAMKGVVRNCIYGVDKNPLAVELCKIALWLEAYNPGEPLNFLDHHIKCGDAIVGLSNRDELEKGVPDEAFKTLPEDDKVIAKTVRDKNAKERKIRTSSGAGQQLRTDEQLDKSVNEAMAEYKAFSLLTETTPEEMQRKERAYRKFMDSKGFAFLRRMADAQVAQFFIPKTVENKGFFMTDADYRLILSGYRSWQDGKIAKAAVVAHENRFFHWFIEFPEVFDEGGFDCILGNPPYLGGTMISGSNSKAYFNYITANFPPASNRCDLAGYFMRRIYSIIRVNTGFAIITTNTIAEGDTRTGGIEKIVQSGGVINYAAKSTPWPGKAAVVVSVISMFKEREFNKVYLYNRPVKFINSFLDEGNEEINPEVLNINANIGYNGSYIFGDGFLIDNSEAKILFEKSPSNRSIIKPYLNGNDLNSSPTLEASRWVIDFGEMSLNEARKFPDCLAILEARVKEFRHSKSPDVAKAPWWQFWRVRRALYEQLTDLKRVLVHTRVTKTHGFAFVPVNQVFSDATVIIVDDKAAMFSFLQSFMHEAWAWKYSSRLKSDRRYSVEDCFQTFPFPNNRDDSKLIEAGEEYHRHRHHLMTSIDMGLTKTYNLFHNNLITAQSIDKKDKQISIMANHLKSISNSISFDAAMRDILRLRELQVQIDFDVLDAYGWSDIKLNHDFYEVDYLPESDRIRFAIHPDARKKVLKRLLELNHQIHEEEVAKGFWNKTKASDKKVNDYKLDDESLGYGPLFDQ